jgi:hypothetical protein
MRQLARRVVSAGGRHWTEVERFDESWKSRIEAMAAYIRAGDAVVDVGCGPMWLRQYLPAGARYTGIDYKYRGEGMVVCDLNASPLPELPADIYFISGCLEYVQQPPVLIERMAALTRRCVISYCCIDEYPDVHNRSKRAWVNSFSADEVRQLFRQAGFECSESKKLVSGNTLFFFEKKAVA